MVHYPSSLNSKYFVGHVFEFGKLTVVLCPHSKMRHHKQP